MTTQFRIRKIIKQSPIRFIKFLSVTVLTGVFNIGNAVQVLPAPRNGSGELGRAAGEVLGRSIGQGLAAAKIAKEQKKQEEERTKQIAKEREILESILKGYDPSKHNEYILMILQSDLPSETKTVITQILNEQHKIYLEEQKQNKGFWSWFRK
jgi:hypothetical protein